MQTTDPAGSARRLPSDSAAPFLASLDGRVLGPSDDGYADAVRIWNAMVAKRPSLVVQPAGVEDVVRTVAFARETGTELSIKGGGHNIAGLGLSDGGVTLDMSSMRSVEVDPTARLARVGPGCTLGDVDRATQEHGLAATLGFVSATGVAGLTLGGGFGYLTRRHGWTVDDLESVEIVTADGTVRRASRDENAELFWALRGGGGNFGVVTEFTFRLHAVGPDVTAGVIAWSGSEAERVLDAFRSLTATASRDLTLAAIRRNAPPAPWLPEAAHGKPVVIVVANHVGEPAEAARDLAPLRAVAEPLADLVMVRPYLAQQQLLDATQPQGNHYYWKSEFAADLTDDLIRAYHAPFEGLRAPANQVVLFHVAGALNQHAEDDGAVGNRDAAFACVVQSMWLPDAPLEVAQANRAWVRGAWEGLRPFSTGGNYVNFQTADEPTERTAASYGANYARLAAAKARYDPMNLFRVNRNILPATG